MTKNLYNKNRKFYKSFVHVFVVALTTNIVAIKYVFVLDEDCETFVGLLSGLM